MNYSSTYKGSGRSGMIYTTSSARMMSIGGGGSMAQAPTASMGSTSSSRGIGMTTSTITTVPHVSGIYTSASAIRGGVTTAETYGSQCAPRRIGGHPGECPHCIDEDGDDICDICGHDIYACECDPCHCDVPLTDGWQVWLFLTILAGAYAIYKARARKKTC